MTPSTRLVSLAVALTACSAPPPAVAVGGAARALGALVVDPPRAGNADGNPAFLQSRFGLHGNFELATPAAAAGLLYYWRDNDHDAFWNGPDAVFTDSGHFDGLSMVESTDTFPGDMEVVATSSGRLSFLFRDSDPATPWHGPFVIGDGVAGIPALVQTSAGAASMLEVVAPSATAGLLHFWRGSDGVWRGPDALFADAGPFDAVGLAASAATGGLDGVARRGSELLFVSRDTGWSGPSPFAEGAAGNPILIERRVSQPGRLEVVFPSLAGGVDHYWRDAGAGWSGPEHLLAAAGAVDGVGAFESSDGALQLVLRQGQSLSLASRVDSQPWQGPAPLSLPTDASYFAEPPPQLHKGYTQYLGTFSGNPVNHQAAFGLSGTDLGVGFITARGDLSFLFGDARTASLVRDNLDSIATCSAESVTRTTPTHIDWVGAGGWFAPLDLRDVDGHIANVPLDGVAIGGRNYIFFNSGWHPYCLALGCPSEHGILALGVMDGVDPAGLSTRFVVASRRFTNVSVVPVGDELFVYGAGEPYRRSPVYLARVAAASIADFSAWQFYRGVRDGAPVFGPGEGTAVPLFAAGSNWSADLLPLEQRPPNGGVGELSARRYNNLYLLTYNSQLPDGRSGIFLRTSPAPWGPWSAPEHLVDSDEAYGRWQHISPVDEHHVVVRPDDGLGEYLRQDEWGAEYGPYLVPRWFTAPASGELGLTYTLSSWNPYQDHLVRSVVTTDGHAVASPPAGSGWPRASVVNGDFATGDTRGWTQLGGPFRVVTRADGSHRVTTFGALGDFTVGQLFQDLAIDAATTQLAFVISGGTSQVKLVWNRTGETVRAVHARLDDAHELPVCWDLRDFQGESVRLLIDDEEIAPWGHVAAGRFHLLDASVDCRDPSAPIWQPAP